MMWENYICFLKLLYYIVTVKIHYFFKRGFIVGGGLQLIFGTDAIYMISAANGYARRVCTIRKSTRFSGFLGKVGIRFVMRKPIITLLLYYRALNT